MKAFSEAHGIDADREPPAHAPADDPACDCADCRDTGWIVEADDGAGTVRQCECSQPDKNPRLLRAMMASAGMETGEINAAFSPWDEEIQAKPTWAHEWLVWAMGGCSAQALPPGVERLPINPRLLTLMGLPGRGKTKTAGVLLRLYIRYGGRGALWARVPEAFDRVQRERSREGFSEFEDVLFSAPFLVLDELGAAHRAKGELIADTVSEWVNRRERRANITLVTTNAEELKQLAEARLESRIASGVYRLMGGPDYRDRR